MRLISWNVNGIRAAYKKGLVEFVERESPDIFCVQETKAHVDQCEPAIRGLGGMHGYWVSAQKKGYSGVATFTKSEPIDVKYGIGMPEYDAEGRVVITRVPEFLLYNIYFPNGGRGGDRHIYKQKFLADLNKHLKPLIAKGEKIIITGDYNVAHKEIDIYDPVKLANESGFMPEEREWLDSFIDLGFVDTFRHFHPDAKDRYSWWSQYERGRLGNRGWRIDYFCVTKNLVPNLVNAEIFDDIESSDHAPVYLELKF